MAGGNWRDELRIDWRLVGVGKEARLGLDTWSWFRTLFFGWVLPMCKLYKKSLPARWHTCSFIKSVNLSKFP